jgi:hypothetical protein
MIKIMTRDSKGRVENISSMVKVLLLAFILLFTGLAVSVAQDLMDLLESETDEETNYTTATFKSTRVLNGHSIERMQEGQLDFRISHRFGTINSGAYEFFGLDEANIHLSLEYGIKNWIMVGVGRGTYQKTVDGFVKFSILRQSTGKKNMPISVSWLSTMGVNTLKWIDPEQTNYFSSRLSYIHQLLVGRKFSDRISLQLSPGMIHRNLVETELEPNDLYSIGISGRIKLTQRISFNSEYFYVIRPKNKPQSFNYYNPLSIGFDIETGGHVFQLHITNSVAMIEKGFIGETTGNWLNGDIHFGFNISRVFTLK